MNGYSYLEDTQELKLEPFRYFYQALAKAKLENEDADLSMQILQLINRIKEGR